MIDALFGQANYVASKKLMDATVLRHQALASNIANLETPHYKRIDLAPSFQVELQRAVGTKQVGQIQSVQPALEVDRTAVAERLDGNNTQLEKELAELQKNKIEHTLSSKLITGSLLRLRLAITGRAT